LGYYDENGDFVYVETCEDMIEHNGTILSYWEIENGEPFSDTYIESDMVIVPIYEVSYCYVTVNYYDENEKYQSVEWEIVEGTFIEVNSNQIGYNDENDDWVYVETNMGHSITYLFDGWVCDSNNDGIDERYGNLEDETIEVWCDFAITADYIYEILLEPEFLVSVAIVGGDSNAEYLDVTCYEEDYMITNNCYEEGYLPMDEITIEVVKGLYEYFVYINGLDIFSFRGESYYLVTNYEFIVNGVSLTNTDSSYSYTTVLQENTDIVIEVYLSFSY
ncbi:MAG: hypothetical protein IJW24_01180, partial [Clostridia bacterium]|nr:hypothetical protein [Clostridia bacterium]